MRGDLWDVGLVRPPSPPALGPKGRRVLAQIFSECSLGFSGRSLLMLRLLLTVVFLLGFSRPCFFALGLSNGSRDTLMMILRRLVALFFLYPSRPIHEFALVVSHCICFSTA